MFEFKHPKYYTELRKRNKAARIPPTSSGQAASDQAISDGASTEVTSVRPGPGLKQQASSSKLRYTPTGILLGVDLGPRPQASSKPKPEPSSGSEDI